MNCLELNVKLDSFDDEWGATLGSRVKDEVEAVLRAEVRKALKADGNFAEVVRLLKNRAIEAAVAGMTMKDIG